MRVEFIAFGELEIDGKRFHNDVLIDGGRIRKRKKKPSKAYREQFGHTPLSADEDLPLDGHQLIIGTGAFGRLPIMPEVLAAAAERGVKIVLAPTEEACELISQQDDKDVYAILHVTC
jgi:hypothetical protein